MVIDPLLSLVIKKCVWFSCQVLGKELVKPLKLPEWQGWLCYANEVARGGPSMASGWGWVPEGPAAWLKGWRPAPSQPLGRDWIQARGSITPTGWNPNENSEHENLVELPGFWAHECAGRVVHPDSTRKRHRSSSFSPRPHPVCCFTGWC